MPVSMPMRAMPLYSPNSISAVAPTAMAAAVISERRPLRRTFRNAILNTVAPSDVTQSVDDFHFRGAICGNQGTDDGDQHQADPHLCQQRIVADEKADGD